MAHPPHKRCKTDKSSSMLLMDPAAYILEISHWIQRYENDKATKNVYAAAGPADSTAPSLLPGIQPPVASQENTVNTAPLHADLSPDVQAYITDITEKNIYNTEHALISTQQFQLTGERKSNALISCLFDVAGICINNDVTRSGFVEISTVEHETTQLVFHRVCASFPHINVPFCANGDACYTCAMGYTTVPLCIYLSVDTQAYFDKTGQLPTTSVQSSVCLLCIRAEFYKNALAFSCAIENHHRQQHTENRFPIPPFQNLCDKPGGYKASCMTRFPNNALALPITICAPSGELKLRTTPDKKTTYFDQGQIMFNPNLAEQDFQ
jgi:hypothetical protein